MSKKSKENIMSRDEISKKIYEIMKEVFGEEKNIQGLDEDLLDKLDSIEFVSLIVEIETEFLIEIDDQDYELEKMSTVNKIAELVERYLNK